MKAPGPTVIGNHHTKANLQRRFVIPAKFRFDILPSLTMRAASSGAILKLTDPR
jgi:hypothetical protein